MSNTKPLGKMTKAELLELAKNNKDIIRMLDLKLTKLYTEKEIVDSKLQKAIEELRILRVEKAINQKVLNRYGAQKALLEEEKGNMEVGKYKLPNHFSIKLLQFKYWVLGLFN